MKERLTLIFISILIVKLGSIQTATAQYDIPAKMEWWYEARFGMFIHFGSYSQLGEGENAVYVDDWVFDRFSEYQTTISAKFNPKDFNAGTIAELVKNAGMKYLVITAKHCEGFAMWKTQVESFTDLSGTKLYSLPDFTEFGDRDILMELKDSCEARGVKFGLYYSILDWNHDSQIPHSNWFTDMVSFQAREDYIRDMKAQLHELVTRYEPAVLWFDGDWTYNSGEPTLHDWWTTTDGRDLYDFLMDMDSTIVVNERVIRGFNLGDYNTAERDMPSRPMSRPWEQCRNMNGSWGYNHKKMSNYKTPSYFIRELVKAVSRDGNYLLNIGPKGDGTVPQQEIDILNAMGEWMDIYGESIYGTTRSPYPSEPSWGYYTKKPGRIYAHVFSWTLNNPLTIPIPEYKVDRICLLNDTSTALPFTDDGATISIQLPAQAPSSINSVVRIELGDVLSSAGQPGGDEITDHSSDPVRLQNFPNPFNQSTTISFQLPAKSNVTLKIFDSCGREVSTLLSQELFPGSYQECWYASDLSSGLYYCQLQAGSFTEIRKLALMR